MVDAIKHDTTSTVATGAWEAGKGALKWIAAIPVTLAVIGAVVGVAATIPAAGAPAVSAGSYVINGLLGAAAGGGLGAVGMGALSVMGAPVVGILAAIGGLFGLAKGKAKADQEHAAYQDRVEHRAMRHRHKMAQKINDAVVADREQTFPVIFNEGRAYERQSMLEQIHQMEQQQAAAASSSSETNHAAKFAKQPAASKAEAVTQQREATANTPPQVGG